MLLFQENYKYGANKIVIDGKIRCN